MATRRPKVRYLREVWMRVIDRERLSKARKRAGYTQYELASLCRCTQAAISGLETGAMKRCSRDLAETLARWLDRDVEELFDAQGAIRDERVTNALGTKRQGAAA